MRKYKLTNTVKLYHISIDPHTEDEIFTPRIPDNFASGEDVTTPRVCVSTSIRGCMRAIEMDGTFDCAWIYVPVEFGGNKIADNIYKPTVDEVPDVVETREKWITCPVKMKCVGFVESLGTRYDHYGRKRDKVIINFGDKYKF
jgi:hypothetical protein